MEYLGTDHSEELQINGNIIPTAKQFQYLGSVVQENGSSDFENEKGISETRRAFSTLNSVLWNRNISYLKKFLIYKSIVRSMLTWKMKYGQSKGSTDINY
jgi:hypothetical protein